MKTLIRQTAMKWWRDMSMIDQSFITQKYSTLLYGRGASSLTSREIEMLYLKEHPILCKHCYSPKGVETGLCSSCGKFPTTAHLKEHLHIQWWNSKNYDTKKRLSEGYIHPTDSGVDPVMFLDDETIREIYLKEHPTEAEVKQPEIYNDNNPALFTVREMREVANDLACKVLFRNDGTATGFWDVCKSIPVVNKKLLSFTEAEVSKEEETYLNKKIAAYSVFTQKYNTPKIIVKEIFEAGITFQINNQKEKDRVLIEDLLEIVNVLSATINPDDYTREFKSKVRNSITKAEQRIKK